MKDDPDKPPSPTSNQALEHIRDALEGLRYGTVTIVVQDGVIVQVERNERFRLTKR